MLTERNPLTRFPDEPGLHERFERLLRDGGAPQQHKSYLERRMQRLMQAGKAGAATQPWQRNSPLLDNWLPRVPATRNRLALELDELGDCQTAFRLLVSLPLKARGLGEPGAAWLQAANILEERLQDPARAGQLRSVVQERTCPEAVRIKKDRNSPASDSGLKEHGDTRTWPGRLVRN